MGFKARPPDVTADVGPIRQIAASLARAVERLWTRDEPLREPRVPNVPLLPSLAAGDQVEWRKPAELYPNGGRLADDLRRGTLSAVWYALRVIPARDSEACLEPALELIAMEPGKKLREACHVALQPSTSKRAFDALFANNAYGASAYPHGCAAARAALNGTTAAAFEPHPAPALSAWNSWTPEVRTTWTQRRTEAASRYRRADSYAATAALHYLARHDWAGSQAMVSAFRDHPAHDVRLQIGHALAHVGTSAALEMLLERLHSSDSWERLSAVRAAFRLDAVNAWTRLGGADLIVAHPEIVSTAFEVLANDDKNVRFDRYPAHGWLQVDDRWHDLAIVWARKTGSARDTAKWVLAALTPEQHRAAKKRAKRAPKPREVAALVPDEATLERWWKRRTFWRDAQAIGETIRRPEVYDVAYPIAVRAMREVRADLERIVATLDRVGYRFVATTPLPRPADNVRAQLTRLESLGGPLPLSVRAAYEVIGPVHLGGWHPRWPVPAHVDAGATTTFWATDPLSLVPLELLIEFAEDNAIPDTTYRLAISADDYGKAGFSGGQYSFEMPCLTADTRLDGAAGSPMFIAYLAESLRWGGFPGFARIEQRPTELLAMLGK